MTMGNPKKSKKDRYKSIIEKIFLSKYRNDDHAVAFERRDIFKTAEELGVDPPDNAGDLVYSFRYRTDLPAAIVERAPKGLEWVIMPAGTARYRFFATKQAKVLPNVQLAETKVPNSTPGVIERYALSDEQALLAKLRYNRLLDVFSCVACYSLQSHLRTQVPDFGQVETDEIYVGVDRKGVHYVFPLQAKGKKDKLSIVQIEQDFAMCAYKFPGLKSRPMAAQFMPEGSIAVFEFEKLGDQLARVLNEKHYRLVPPDQISDQELKEYSERPD